MLSTVYLIIKKCDLILILRCMIISKDFVLFIVYGPHTPVKYVKSGIFICFSKDVNIKVQGHMLKNS